MRNTTHAMTRQIKQLYPKLCRFTHLLAAYKKARKGTQTTEAARFEFALEHELLQLRHELLTETYQPQPYSYFTIYDPKEREISVAPFRDRVVHHAIVALLEQYFEPRFIYHSYATRKGKGTHAAVFAAQTMLRKANWYLKADVRKYFLSINHNVLLAFLQKHIKDRQFMLLLEITIRNAGNNGLPIGNLTSQFFANVYLNAFDHYILRQLKPSAYIRYMDDFVLFDNDSQKLKSLLAEIELYLAQNLKLTLKPKAVILNRTEHGLSFLGTRIFRGTVRIHRSNLRRSLKRLRLRHHQWKTGYLPETNFIASANSIVAHLAAYNTYRLRQKIRFWSKGF